MTPRREGIRVEDCDLELAGLRIARRSDRLVSVASIHYGGAEHVADLLDGHVVDQVFGARERARAATGVDLRHWAAQLAAKAAVAALRHARPTVADLARTEVSRAPSGEAVVIQEPGSAHPGPIRVSLTHGGGVAVAIGYALPSTCGRCGAA